MKELEWLAEIAKFGRLLAKEEETTLMDTLKALVRSRKVLLAAFGVVQTFVAHYLNVPVEVWASVDALVVTVIGSVAYEDAAGKSQKPE